MYFLLILSHCVKRYEHFCQILALFTMPTHQIWSCHATRVNNFEKFLFCPNSTFNIRKSHKNSRGKALYVRSYQAKTSRGVKAYHNKIYCAASQQNINIISIILTFLPVRYYM